MCMYLCRIKLRQCPSKNHIDRTFVGSTDFPYHVHCNIVTYSSYILVIYNIVMYSSYTLVIYNIVI